MVLAEGLLSRRAVENPRLQRSAVQCRRGRLQTVLLVACPSRRDSTSFAQGLGGGVLWSLKDGSRCDGGRNPCA